MPKIFPQGRLCPYLVTYALNFFTDLLESEQKTIILVITDHFSCSIHLIPLAGLPTAFKLAEIMFNQVFRFYGIPEDVVSDQDPQFTSQVLHSFLEKLGMMVSLISGYQLRQMDRWKEITRRLAGS